MLVEKKQFWQKSEFLLNSLFTLLNHVFQHTKPSHTVIAPPVVN